MATLTSGAPRSAATSMDRALGTYFVAQALVGVVFWSAVQSVDGVRTAIELTDQRAAATDAFFVADLLIVAGSLVTAWALFTGRSWAPAAAWFTAGAVVYPTIFLVGWVAMTGDSAVGLVVMIPPSTITCWVAYEASRSRTAA